MDAPVSETLGLGARASLPRLSSFPAAAERPGPNFVEHEEIGRGGMATVWAASQTALGREVAVKRVSDPSDKQAESLLLSEAIVTGQLEHPNIVPVHQLVVDARGPAVVMKRVSGKTWDQLIADPGVGLESQLDIFLQTLNAVSFAHSRGVVHRDIKPQNVMIGEYGEVYLLDWGVAKRKDDPPSSIIVGTLRYMAPEMVYGQADERTDIFLLGATLHHVLTGLPRHDGDTALSVLYAAMYVEPYAYPSSVPSELAELCNRACARSPEERFACVNALREAVLRFREHRAANVLTDTAMQQLARLQSLTAREPSVQVDSDVQRLFSEAHLSFEAALRVWPDSPSALSGLTRCLQTMFDYELARRQLEPASAMLAILPARDEARSARLSQLRAELERERLRFENLERDRDPNVGALGRTRAYLGMGAATALMTAILYARRLLLPNQELSTLRLTVVGALVLVLMLVVAALWRRFGVFNLINRRIAEISISTLAVSFASRLSGYLTDTTPERVLTTDAFILGLGGVALSPYHPAGPWLSSMSFSVALVGSLYPSVIDELFIALSIFVPAALLLWKRRKLLPRGDRNTPLSPVQHDRRLHLRGFRSRGRDLG